MAMTTTSVPTPTLAPSTPPASRGGLEDDEGDAKRDRMRGDDERFEGAGA